MHKSKMILRLALAALALGLCGCHRSEDDFDNRTLENMPVTETVKPVDRGDMFRP